MTLQSAIVVLRAARGLRSLSVAVVVAAVVAVTLGARDETILKGIGMFGLPLASFATIASLFEYSQRSSVWLMISQRAGTDVGRMWSLLGAGALVYVCVSAILVAGVASGTAMNPEGAVGSSVLVFTLWMVVVGCTVVLTSTAARTSTAALAIGWMAVPFVLVILQQSLGFSDRVLVALEFFAPPFNAVFSSAQMLRGELPERAVPYTAQLISFPILCLVATHFRLKVLAKPDQSRIE